MNETKRRGGKKKSLYECTKAFLEQMNRRFPDGCDKSTVFIIASDGKHISSLFGGDDDTMKSMISYITVKDDEVRNVVGEGLLSTIQLIKAAAHGEPV